MATRVSTRGPARARSRVLVGTVVVFGAVSMAACSGGETIPAPSLSQVTTAGPGASTTPANPSTSEPPASTTAAATSVAAPSSAPAPTDAGITGPMFSAALGVKVDAAPGVTTRGDTRQLLPEGLYVHIAWESDPDDTSVFTVQPDDIEILEAYANASLAYYRAALTTVTTDAPEFAEYFVDAGAQYDEGFAEARAGGYVGSLGAGVVLRPYVLGDQRTATSAVVYDCYLENQEYILRRGGVSSIGPLEPSGTVATMTMQSGSWQVDIIAAEPGACF